MSFRRFRALGLSFIEVVIAIFLLAFVGLSVLAMTQTGFLAQRRNQELVRATLVAQTLIAEMRIWASDINNFQSGWGPYNRTYTPPDYNNFIVTLKAQAAGRALDSPSSEMESQWESTPRGTRRLPRAVVPVEIDIAWSTRVKDRLHIITYVGEPVRNVVGANFNIVGPNPSSIGQDETAEYTIAAFDAGGRPLDNLMFDWVTDPRFLSQAPDSARDGRRFRLVRDIVLGPNDTLPPSTSPVQCYGTYAGQPVVAVPNGVGL